MDLQGLNPHLPDKDESGDVLIGGSDFEQVYGGGGGDSYSASCGSVPPTGEILLISKMGAI